MNCAECLIMYDFNSNDGIADSSNGDHDQFLHEKATASRPAGAKPLA